MVLLCTMFFVVQFTCFKGGDLESDLVDSRNAAGSSHAKSASQLALPLRVSGSQW